MKKRFCPTCKKLGQKSTITSQGNSSKCMSYFPYWDERGDYHSHNPNIITTIYKCSHKHTWSEQHLASCPQSKCDWNNQELVLQHE